MTIDPRLEREYVFSDRYPERGSVYARIADASTAARRDWPVHVDLSYGPHPRERLDVFPGRPGSAVLVFIHGGYWSSHDKSSFSYVAPPFLRRGYSVALIGYPLAPAVTVTAIARSVRAAVSWLAGQGSTILPRAQGFYLCGHSAGANLAALAAVSETQHQALAAGRAPPVAGCVLVSGIFDARPLLQTSIAQRAGLDEASAAAISPLSMRPPPGWVLAGVGGAETSAFVAQTHDYVAHCRAHAIDAAAIAVPGANHYTVLLDLAQDDGVLATAIDARIRR